jgi:hypothetical protein
MQLRRTESINVIKLQPRESERAGQENCAIKIALYSPNVSENTKQKEAATRWSEQQRDSGRDVGIKKSFCSRSKCLYQQEINRS